MLAAVAIAGLSVSTHVQASGDFEAGIGYMERSERAFGFVKADGVIYEDQFFAHKLGLEYIGYQESLSSALDTDITFSTIVMNYEIEYKISPEFYLFAGVGLGGQYASLDSPVGELDNDVNAYAQAFAGIRAKLAENFDMRIGVRRMFFDDYELLGVSDIQQDQTWGFDLGFTIRF